MRRLLRSGALGALMTLAPPMTGLVPFAAAEEVNEGEKAPDFTLQDSEGTTYRLSDYQGKKSVVLEFIRSGSW